MKGTQEGQLIKHNVAAMGESSSELLAEVIHLGEAAVDELSKVIESLNSALGFSRGEYWAALMLSEVPKYFYYWQAKRRGHSTRRAIDDFLVALGDLGQEHAAEFHMGVKGKEALLDLFSPGNEELLLDSTLTQNRIVANIALSRVRRVVRALEDPEFVMGSRKAILAD